MRTSRLLSVVSAVGFLVLSVMTPQVVFGGGLTISGDNVGIGTTTPAYPLQVEAGLADRAIEAHSSVGTGVYGASETGHGVIGDSDSNTGVQGTSNSGVGVYGITNTGYAGFFVGPVSITSGGWLNVHGNITTTSGYFSGSGSGLTNLNGANITAGTVGSGAFATGAVATSDIADGAVTAAKINSTGLDADTVDGQHSADIISAASDEVRMPISSLPFTITTSGSYYLTGNLSSAGNGIMVSADDVTIDFNGFTITGPGQPTGTGYGVQMNGRTNVEIKNGTVTRFGQVGIYESGSGRGHRIIHMRVEYNCVGSCGGIVLYGDSHLILDCSSIGNGYRGIDASSSIINGNTANHNMGIGIFVGDGSTVIGNTAYRNTEDGIWVGGSGSTVKNNTSYFNSRNGIYLGNYELVDGNAAFNNNQGGGGYVNMTACATCVLGDNVAP